MRCAAGHDIFKPHKPADAVFKMHHKFTDGQRRNIGNKIFGADFLFYFSVLFFT